MVYGRVLFSAHMTAHMIMAMAVPLFLVLGAPITLALRALRARSDGSRGPREWVLAVAESPVSRVVAHPVVAATLFAVGPFAVYFSGLFPLALGTHVGHELMQLHFLASGYLFLWVLIGVDPGPRRPGPPFRMLVLFVTVSVHAFFGVTLMSATTVLAQEYFGALGRTWGKPLLEDQSDGGAIAWGFGELPMLAVALILAVQWSRSDAREARRLDRAADRDHDADLVAYNAMLTRMAQTRTPAPGNGSEPEPGDNEVSRRRSPGGPARRP
jgi:cytochrome c oxidase assembly factor CtaG